jgi:hypothetical protein
MNAAVRANSAPSRTWAPVTLGALPAEGPRVLRQAQAPERQRRAAPRRPKRVARPQRIERPDVALGRQHRDPLIPRRHYILCRFLHTDTI